VSDWKQTSRKAFDPLVRLLARLGVHPNALTVAGFLLSLVPAGLLVRGHFLGAGVILALVTPLDLLDGQLARSTGKTTRFGALLDSTLDRISEFLLLGGYLVYFRGHPVVQVQVFFLLLFAFLVSYVRARGEGLGVSVQAGPMDRTGRYLAYILLTLAGPRSFAGALPVLLVLVALTVVRRMAGLYNSLNSTK